MFLNTIERAGVSFPLRSFGVCKIGDIYYATLEEAFEIGGEIDVLDNICISNYIDIAVGKVITLNLNGYKIYAHRDMSYAGGMFRVHNGGTFHVYGPGEIYANSTVYAGIGMTVKGDDEGLIATLTLNGGVRVFGNYYAVCGSGNRNRTNTDITVNDAYLTGIQRDDNVGIYHPQGNSILTINGGLIEGRTGIEMRGGKLVMNGGEVIGTAFPTETQANGNGSTSIGAGVAVAMHTTNNPVEVEINKGILRGYSAFYESNPNGMDVSKVSLNIKGGDFCAINNGTMTVYSENKTGFITAGNFSPAVAEEYRA